MRLFLHRGAICHLLTLFDPPLQAQFDNVFCVIYKSIFLIIKSTA